MVFLSPIKKWHLSKRNRSAYCTLYAWKDKHTPEKFQTPTFNTLFPFFSKIKILSPFLLSLTVLLSSLSLSLNSKAPQPLPSIAPGKIFKDSLSLAFLLFTKSKNFHLFLSPFLSTPPEHTSTSMTPSSLSQFQTLTVAT